jgi:hypothetical protein
MKPKLYVLIILWLAVLSTACANRDQPGPSPTATSSTQSNVPEVTTTGTVYSTETELSSTPTSPSVAPDLPLSQYNLSAHLDYDAHTLTVDQQISYINYTGNELSELLLLVEPNRYPGGFTLDSLVWEDDEEIIEYSLLEHELLILLPTPLSPGGSIGLGLSYRLSLPNQNEPYGYTDRQTNLGDWYPYIPPFIPGEGWYVRDVSYPGEHLAYEIADFDVEISLSSPYSTSGAELIIAASSLPEMKEETYQYRHKAARNFTWSISDQYQVQDMQVGEVTVLSYSFPYHPLADQPALEETAKSLSVFQKLFSPYPHKSLSVVEADFLNGHEYDGLIFLSHAFYDYYTGDQKSNLTIIAAHEVAHQWWYGLIGNDQALEPWLDESLSTFSELYYYENEYPQDTDWWWENRITFHEPKGWVDSTIYEVDGFYPYRDAVYLRGAMFLGELRDLMGEEAFLDFLRGYLDKFKYRLVSGDDFFNLLTEYTSADLSSLIGDYFTHR